MAQRTDWMTLANTMIGVFLVGLAARTFVISLPTVASGLGTDMLGISWALIAYQVAGIGLGVLVGRLGDLYSRDRIYGLGVVIITVGTVLCGVAQNIGELILFRFLQGVGGAIIQSSGRALAMEAMPEGSEGKAQGLMSMAHQFGFFVGPPVGGFIIDWISWRGIFFFMVPFGLAAIVLTYLPQRGAAPRAAGRGHAVDYGGAALFMILTVVMTLLLDQKMAALLGTGSKAALALGLAGLTWGFLSHEGRTSSPMLEPYFFKIRFFTYSTVALLAICITQGLSTLVIPFYLQGVLGLSASFMGILFLVPSILNLASSPASGHMNDRIGSRVPLLIGLSCFIAAFFVGANLKAASHWAAPTFLLALVGLGAGFFNVPIQAAMVISLPKEHWGSATGMIHTVFGLGSMLGISIGGFLLTLAFRHYSGISDAMPDPGNALAFASSVNLTFAGGMAMALLALWAVLKCGKAGGRRPLPAGVGEVHRAQE